MDACNSLIALCHERPAECLGAVLEQGFLTRLGESLDLSVLSEISLLVACAVVRASVDPSVAGSGKARLVQAVALACGSSARAKPTLQYIVELLGKTDSNVARKDMCSAVAILCDGNARHAALSLQFGVIERLSAVLQQGCPFDVRSEAGHCLCRVLLNCSPLQLDEASSSQV